MAHRWLRIRVDLLAGRGEQLADPPGRIMLVPPTATYEELGLGIDLALGRWDVTRRRSFRAEPFGRHERRRRTRDADEITPTAVIHDSVAPGSRFEYVFDDDAKWVHACLVEEFVAPSKSHGRPPIAVPVLGWGTIPDQDGHREPFEALMAARQVPQGVTQDGADEGTQEVPAVPAPVRREPDTRRTDRKQRRTADPGPIDLRSVRAAVATGDAAALLEATEGRDLSAALQQVGDGLSRAYRAKGNGAPVQARLATALRGVEDLLRQRDWEGDDVLAEEIGALLNGSERRGRTLTVDIAELADVMSSGGDDPGGYLHLDTGEVVHAFLHHNAEDDDLDDGADLEDNLWIYVDHDAREAWQDMAAFARSAPNDLNGILSVAVQGKGAFSRFRRTVDELGLWTEWQVFADDRQWGRARALLRSQGIRPV